MTVGVKDTCPDGQPCLRRARGHFCIGECAIAGMMRAGPARIGPVVERAEGGNAAARAVLDRAGVPYSKAPV